MRVSVDDPERIEMELNHVIPEDNTRPYDMKKIINLVVDQEEKPKTEFDEEIEKRKKR